MPTQLPVGPLREIAITDQLNAPFYVIPFDRGGVCTGPQTRASLLNHLRTNPISDVFIFSHGWNNTWKDAIDRYDRFIQEFVKVRKSQQLPLPANYRPILIGVFWPSTALVFGESEVGPGIAGDATSATQVGSELTELEELANDLSAADRPRFYELAQQPQLSKDKALELARLALKIPESAENESPFEPATSDEGLLRSWLATKESPEEPQIGDFGVVHGNTSGTEPQAAGFLDRLADLDPRNAIRLLTVRKMKDRAGVVGTKGVGALLRDVLSAGTARVHLVGHSYGARVVLSAAGFGGSLPRKAHSMLLLQPAVSHLCFAETVTNTGRPGGYRAVLERVERPILSTFSENDFPLTRVFQFALRRDADLGEAQIAAFPNPPSPYAALGGYGPRGCQEELIKVLDPGQPYSLNSAKKIYGINATRTISGHGDVENPSTSWMLHTLLS